MSIFLILIQVDVRKFEVTCNQTCPNYLYLRLRLRSYAFILSFTCLMTFSQSLELKNIVMDYSMFSFFLY